MSDIPTEDKVLLRIGYLWPISSTHEWARIANVLDILIIVIRTAISHTTEIENDGNNSNALIQHALNAPVGVPLPSYNDLLATVGNQLQFNSTTLLSDLVEHKFMIETLWDRTEFIRFSGQAYRRVVFEHNKWQWKPFPLQSCNAAQESLVEWDGREDLGHHISRDYRARRGPDILGPICVICGPERATIIRVRYTPAPGHTRDFNDIRTFVVRGSTMRQVDEHFELEVTTTTYDIVAVVKCFEADFDRIRLYDMYGRFFPAPMFIRNNRMQELDCRYFSLDWDVNEPGQYMLFYAKRQEREFPDFRTPDVLLTAHKLMAPSMYTSDN